MAFDQKAYSRAHYLKNKQAYIDRAKARYAGNREACIKRAARRNAENKPSRLAVTRRFYQNHKEKWAEWRRNNPEKAKKNWTIYVANRRARLANAPGTFTFEEWMAKVAYHGWRCFYCRIKLTLATLTMDHRKPLSKGGSNWLSNMVPACKPCNCRKWAK